MSFKRLHQKRFDCQHDGYEGESIGQDACDVEQLERDPNLETDTRAKAEQQLQASALSDGILDTASKNARATVTTLLYGLGFKQVEVT